jgi:hypothetical protein
MKNVRACKRPMHVERTKSRTFRWCAFATIFSFSIVFWKILQI